MRTHFVKYLAVFTILPIAYISLAYQGVWSYAMLMYVFVVLPALELIFQGTTHNFTKDEESTALADRKYDYLLYAIVPIQYVLLGCFLYTVSQNNTDTPTLIGRMVSFGIICGVLAINVAHELGHRSKTYEQLMAKALLLSTLYLHFFIEHNRGHHKWVSTDEDPASARRGEMLYAFWLRSVWGSYVSAWKLENERVRKKEHIANPLFTWKNEMLRFTVYQAAVVAAIALFFGGWVAACFVVAAIIGWLMLETVNYIEHYGLRRKKTAADRYERVMPHHSWNSNHSFGRVMLFELTRHSDHHYLASRKYQVLRHFDQSPQLPTGYPGTMLLALVPPLFFYVMHRQIARFQEQQTAYTETKFA
ncbi:MAG: alkane 1-monooxygenase [Sphingobacteriales bacterium]|nr:alkane 1-monooxygenase [Sphingobacteriales bacterium]